MSDMEVDPVVDLRTRRDLLKVTLAVSVPHRMAEIFRRGGPSQLDREWLAAAGERFGLGVEDDPTSDASAISFSDGRSGSTRAWTKDLINAIAILGFAPGGVTAFGLHFDAGTPDQDGKVCCWTWPFRQGLVSPKKPLPEARPPRVPRGRRKRGKA